MVSGHLQNHFQTAALTRVTLGEGMAGEKKGASKKDDCKCHGGTKILTLILARRSTCTCEVVIHGAPVVTTHVTTRYNMFQWLHLSTFQEVLPTLEGHVVAIFVTLKVHLRQG